MDVSQAFHPKAHSYSIKINLRASKNINNSLYTEVMVPGWFNYLLLSLTRGRYSGPIAQSQGSDISHGFVPGHGRENWVNERAWGLSTISHGGVHQIERI